MADSPTGLIRHFVELNKALRLLAETIESTDRSLAEKRNAMLILLSVIRGEIVIVPEHPEVGT